MTTAIGARIHRVTVQNPGTAAANADGAYTQTYTDAAPADWQVAIRPATARELERLVAGTVLAQASHVVTGPYRADVTTQTRLLFGSRTLNVIGVSNPDERNRETIAICTEVVT